jgi:hypothetical protein
LPTNAFTKRRVRKRKSPPGIEPCNRKKDFSRCPTTKCKLQLHWNLNTVSLWPHLTVIYPYITYCVSVQLSDGAMIQLVSIGMIMRYWRLHNIRCAFLWAVFLSRYSLVHKVLESLPPAGYWTCYLKLSYFTLCAPGNRFGSRLNKAPILTSTSL